MPHPIRDKLQGITDWHDRLWIITMPDGSQEAMTDYNWEIVGVTERIFKEFNIGYGDNAYYWTSELVKRNCKVEHMDDRKL